MELWLGRQHPWQDQVGADLGERMFFAIAQAFRRGFQRVVLVGADCPGVSTDILAQAFQALQDNDLVLGPTMDGGYYLIGLSRPLPALFDDMPWGGDQVLAQTMAVARRAGLQPALLACLADVDRPEDLDGVPANLLSHLP
jgi:rSAM/selenodomain-associated transferase 1